MNCNSQESIIHYHKSILKKHSTYWSNFSSIKDKICGVFSNINLLHSTDNLLMLSMYLSIRWPRIQNDIVTLSHLLVEIKSNNTNYKLIINICNKWLVYIKRWNFLQDIILWVNVYIKKIKSWYKIACPNTNFISWSQITRWNHIFKFLLTKCIIILTNTIFFFDENPILLLRLGIR